MARPKKINSKGMGWHKESVRHSRARKTGRAGGKYKGWRHMTSAQRHNAKLDRIMEFWHKELKEKDKLSQQKYKKPYDELLDNKKRKIDYLHSDLKDTDGDGVPDKYDCQPNNPEAQDTYRLEPRYDSRKSFYGKAIVEIDNGTKKLYSYNTLVAKIDKDGKAIVYRTYSSTTLRHIKEFLKQNGFKAESSNQIIKDYPDPADTQALWEKKKEFDKKFKEETGLDAGDREGLIELIQRDTSPEAQEQLVDVDEDALQEDFQDELYDELQKWDNEKLLDFYKKQRIK